MTARPNSSMAFGKRHIEQTSHADILVPKSATPAPAPAPPATPPSNRGDAAAPPKYDAAAAARASPRRSLHSTYVSSHGSESARDKADVKSQYDAARARGRTSTVFANLNYPTGGVPEV